jgi:NhaP-type Na+/H+ or K+/H+ antiporter
VVVSLAASYFLIFLFQKIRTELKLFLLIAVLILLYSLSKMFHLSSLLIILVFGLILSNRNIFFPGKMQKYLNEGHMATIFDNFKMITLESSFVVRTFFFVIFGFTIVLTSLLDLKVWLVSILILGILYGLRWAWFRLVIRKDIYPDVWMAPRGLITILLFYSIPEDLVVAEFNTGILLLVILVSSIMMAVSLIKYRKSGPTDPMLDAEDSSFEAITKESSDLLTEGVSNTESSPEDAPQ